MTTGHIYIQVTQEHIVIHSHTIIGHHLHIVSKAYQNPFTYNHRSLFTYQSRQPNSARQLFTGQNPFTFQSRQPNSARQPNTGPNPFTFQSRQPNSARQPNSSRSHCYCECSSIQSHCRQVVVSHQEQ